MVYPSLLAPSTPLFSILRPKSLPPSLLLFIYTSKVNTELYNVQVLSLVLLQLLELSLTLFLLRSTAKPQFKSFNFLKGTNNSVGRNWVVGSALGFGTLVAFIFLTSLVAHQLFPSQVSLSLSLLNLWYHFSIRLCVV